MSVGLSPTVWFSKLSRWLFFSSKYICIFTYNLHKPLVAQLCRWENRGTGRLNLLSMVLLFSVAKSCLILCDPMDCRMPGFPVLHYLPEFAQTHVHWVDDAIQPSCPLLSPSPPAFNLSQHQSLFQSVGSSQQVTEVLEPHLQDQSCNEYVALISYTTN